MAWGRTDSGVHALGAVVTVDFTLEEVRQLARRQERRCCSNAKTVLTATKEIRNEEEKDMPDQEMAALFLHAVLKEFDCDVGLLGDDNDEVVIMPQTRFGSITAQSVIPVPSHFDARYSARWKRYIYYICATDGNSKAMGSRIIPSSPFAWNRYAWHVKQSLDYESMINATKLLSGMEHNFEWLCIIQRGEMRDTRRTIKLHVEKVPITNADAEQVPYFLRQSEGTATLFVVRCECDFYLYKMMRRIVGVLVAVGKHDATIDSLQQCLDAYDKRDGNVKVKPIVPDKLLNTAPAKGLCLEHIEYDEDFVATIS